MQFDHLLVTTSKYTLSRSDLKSNPYDQLIDWFNLAKKEGVKEPNAVALATAALTAIPSSRMVLIKEIRPNGVTFFTHYFSRKGIELKENPKAMGTIYWKELALQIQMEGAVEPLSKEESAAYFATRSRESQLGAWASPQGKKLASREALHSLIEEYQEKFLEKPIPLPSHWGGYLLKFSRCEFWCGRKDRLHDRFEYILEDNQWKIHRLAP